MSMETITASPSTGYYIVGRNATLFRRHTTGGFVQLDPKFERPPLSLVNDWGVYAATSTNGAVELAKKEGDVEWCRTLAESCAKISDQETLVYLFEEIEKLLASLVSENDVISRMLIAPYREFDHLMASSKLAASHGFAVAGDLFHKLHDLQPLIGRLSEKWLNLPKEAFLGLDTSKERLWSDFANKGVMISILEAASESEMKDLFGKLVFGHASVPSREAVARVGNVLAEELFGHSEIDYADLAKEEDAGHRKGKRNQVWKRHSSHEELTRALSEIGAITKALSTGKDYLADRFISELVERQMADRESTEYAVKSLCNIGQRCAEMFRTDFEHRCLESAMTINASDSWLLIQNADHLKRTGQYDRAVEIVTRAFGGGEDRIAVSLLADIHSQRGEYERAIVLYQSITDWEQDDRILVGIADNYRRLGKLDEAKVWYETARAFGNQNDRVLAGLAEIAKREGRLTDAVKIYEGIVNRPDLDDQSRWFYSLILAENLRAVEDFQRAYILIEDVLAEAPFFMKARVLRSSLLGLMGNTEEALASLPEGTGIAALGEWIEAYTRGLLLLLTRNYADARYALDRSLTRSVLREDEMAVIRLASALSSISVSDTGDARKYLDAQPKYDDARIKYLDKILRYHIAIIEDDAQLTNAMRDSIASLPDPDPSLAEIVALLNEKRVAEAFDLEVIVMLQIAA